MDQLDKGRFLSPLSVSIHYQKTCLQGCMEKQGFLYLAKEREGGGERGEEEGDKEEEEKMKKKE